MHFGTTISGVHFKIAPSKNAFQNCYSIVNEAIRIFSKYQILRYQIFLKRDFK